VAPRDGTRTPLFSIFQARTLRNDACGWLHNSDRKRRRLGRCAVGVTVRWLAAVARSAATARYRRRVSRSSRVPFIGCALARYLCVCIAYVDPVAPGAACRALFVHAAFGDISPSMTAAVALDSASGGA